MPLIPRSKPVDVVAATVRSGRAARPGAAGTPCQQSPSPRSDPDRSTDLPMADLHEVLAGRSAVRTFGARRPTARLVAAVVALALEHVACHWPVDVHGPPPGLLLAAFDVAGLEPGIHRWKGSDSADGFRVLAQPSWFGDLQGRYCAAPAMFLLHGSPLRAGAGGYGDLLVRVGSLGHALWLAARTYGLDACAFGGPSPEVTALLRTSADAADADVSTDVAERHLFTLAAGYAADG